MPEGHKWLPAWVFYQPKICSRGPLTVYLVLQKQPSAYDNGSSCYTAFAYPSQQNTVPSQPIET